MTFLLLAVVCVLGPLPDLNCTPGVATELTKEQVCSRAWGKDERKVTEQMKRKTYSDYGILSHKPGEFEIDHLISRELGGADDAQNLWPEAAEPRPGFHEKDHLENFLHHMLCTGLITLPQAQAMISGDWIAVYRKLILSHATTGPSVSRKTPR